MEKNLSLQFVKWAGLSVAEGSRATHISAWSSSLRKLHGESAGEILVSGLRHS